MITRTLGRLFGASLLAVIALAGPVSADTAADSKVVGNVLIYMGILPAPMVRGRPPTHPEASMHGGVPALSDEYHIVIALFDAKTNERISDAEVSASVSEIAMAPETKKLEPMAIANTITYGNYFQMAGSGPFKIAVAVRLHGSTQQIKAEFEHRHQ